MPAAEQRTKPKAGLEFVREYKQKTYKLKAVKADGGVGHELGGTLFTSPSTVAKLIMTNEIKGRIFWDID